MNRRPPQSCVTTREDKGAVRQSVYLCARAHLVLSPSLPLLPLTYTGACLHGVAQVTHQLAALVHSKVVTAQAGEVLGIGRHRPVRLCHPSEGDYH